MELREANELVARLHRHHAPVYRDKFRIGCVSGKKIVGVVQLGRPVSRGLDDGRTIEVTRLCTDGTANVCSFLLGRAAAVAKLMGYARIVTYTLESENGSSLRASGWSLDGLTDAKSWDCKSRPRTMSAPTCRKKRWVKCLKMEENT